jgi:hypothetical protein
LLDHEISVINERAVLKEKLGNIHPEELMKLPKIDQCNIESDAFQERVSSLVSISKGSKTFSSKVPLNQNRLQKIDQLKSVAEDSNSSIVSCSLKVRTPPFLLTLDHIHLQKWAFLLKTLLTALYHILNAISKHPTKLFLQERIQLATEKFLFGIF